MTNHRQILAMGPVLLVVAALAFTPAGTWAQGATPAPLSKVTVSDDVAKRTLMKDVINADTARAIVNACVEWQKTQTAANNAVAIYVLSPTGQIVDGHVMDGVAPIGAETALLKAKTVLYARSPSSAVVQRFNNVEGQLIRMDLGKEQGLAYYFTGGGLPIIVEGRMIGAVGVGGGNAEEMCGYQAITKVVGPQPPLAAPPAAGGGGRGGAGRGGQ